MMGRRSAFVLTAMLGAQGCLISAAIAEPVAPAEPPLVVADDQQAPASDTSLRKRAEDLARAASEAFTDIMARGRKQKEQVAQGAAPKPAGDAGDTGAIGGAFAPVWGWLARSAKDYQDVIVAKLKNPSGDVVILAPQRTVVVAQKDAAPALPEKKPSELTEQQASEPRAGWSWAGVVETARDWLARANRSYRNEIVKKLVRPTQPQSPDAVTQWPPAEVVPQAPSPADTAAEAEAEQHAAEVRRAAEEAEAQRHRDAETQKQADEDKRRQQAEAQTDAKRKTDEAKRVADEADAKTKADEAKRVADEAEAKRKSEEKRLADEAEAKRKADVEAKRVAGEADAKRKADEAKRVADAAEAKRNADEAKRVADEAEAKRKTEEKRLAEEAEARRKADADAKRVAGQAQAKREADAETERRLKEETETETKAVAESEATRLATEAEAKRAAAAGVKPAHENSSVAIARPPSQRAPARAPVAAEQERKARKEVLVAEPVPPKIVKKKRRVAANYDVRPKKHKRGPLAAHKQDHKYVLVEERRPKRFVHAYRQKSHAAPPLPLRSKAPACGCARASRAPTPHHVRPYAAWHGYKTPRVAGRSCGDGSYFGAPRWTHHRKSRHPNLIFQRPRLYISPERR